MNLRVHAAALLLGGALSGTSLAGVVGTTLTDVELEGFAQTEARSYGDFTGRLLLIEFFAYW